MTAGGWHLPDGVSQPAIERAAGYYETWDGLGPDEAEERARKRARTMRRRARRARRAAKKEDGSWDPFADQ